MKYLILRLLTKGQVDSEFIEEMKKMDRMTIEEKTAMVEKGDAVWAEPTPVMFEQTRTEIMGESGSASRKRISWQMNIVLLVLFLIGLKGFLQDIGNDIPRLIAFILAIIVGILLLVGIYITGQRSGDSNSVKTSSREVEDYYSNDE